MNEVALPNEVMLDSSEKALLRRCINTLSAESLSKELGQGAWTVTRAEFCETESFLGEMQFFRDRHPREYQQLCEAIGERKRIGIFQFQLARTSEMGRLPNHVVGRSLLTITDEDQIAPIWRLTSLVSR